MIAFLCKIKVRIYHLVFLSRISLAEVCLCVASIFLYTGCVNTSQKYIQNMRYAVAVGTLKSYNTNSWFAIYDISHVMKGHISTNIIQVDFYSNSVPEDGLPENAVLILERKYTPYYMHVFEAIGGDAYRGILPDNEVVRQRIGNEDNLYENPKEKWISKREALWLAYREVILHEDRYRGTTRTMMICLDYYRYNYGWMFGLADVAEGNMEYFSMHAGITVGDDGIIKR